MLPSWTFAEGRSTGLCSLLHCFGPLVGMIKAALLGSAPGLGLLFFLLSAFLVKTNVCSDVLLVA